MPLPQLLRVAAINAAFITMLYIPTAGILYMAGTTEFTPSDLFSWPRFLILILFAPILIKYAVQICIAPFYSIVESRRYKTNRTYTPSVSVLVPAHNEEVGIRRTLQSVLASHYPFIEIIVVDDGSTDRTYHEIEAVVAAYTKSGHTDRRIIAKRIPQSGKSRALNEALSLSSSEIVITIDSDCIVDPRAIRNLARRFDDPTVASVAGNVAIGNRFKPLGMIQQLEYLYGFYFKRADSLFNAVYIVGGAAAAYRRNIITELGGFDENIITEDIELSTRLQHHGHNVRYAADALIYTEGPSDIAGLCRQRLRWKFGRLVTFYRYRHLFFSLNPKHNQFLTFLVLPIALFAEVLLFFEGILLSIFYAYTFITNDFAPLVFVIFLLSGVIVIQMLSDVNTRHHWNILFLAPGAWVLFYLMDIVEYQALVRSLWHLHQKKDPTWQEWDRLGVFGTASPTQRKLRG